MTVNRKPLLWLILSSSLLFANLVTAQQAIPVETDCANGIDDNGNGLEDMRDSHCYFYEDSLNHSCPVTNVIWVCSPTGVFWRDIVTKEEKLIEPLASNSFLDITWGPDGNLYALEGNVIASYDPRTWVRKVVGEMQNYYANGMTADAYGFFYLTAYDAVGQCEIIKLDPKTFQIETIARISDYGLFATGDCCFLNGYIYATCTEHIAKVNMQTRAVEKMKVDNINGSYAITTLGDGYLYVTTNGTEIYRLDPATSKATLIDNFQSDVFSFGYTSYADPCASPCRKPVVSLGADTVVCDNSVLLLTPQVDNSVNSYLWSSGSSQMTDTIRVPGTYWIKAGNMCHFNSDTIVVGSADKPQVKLQADTMICMSNSIVLQNLLPVLPRDQFLWSDNSTASTLKISKPETYWLQMSNVCGSVTDTVVVMPKIDSCECFVFVPNAFSPNEDHVNDHFEVSSNCLLQGSIQVFNRWGQLVYKSEKLDAGWNGTSGNHSQPAGLYVYSIRFSYLDRPGTFTRKGTLTLIR